MKVTVDKSLIEQAIEALDEADPYVAEVSDEIYEFHVNHPIRLKYQQSAKAREEKNRAAQKALHAALAEPVVEPEKLGGEWAPCMKLPVVVHVCKQRPNEQHVSTREGITPIKTDDLIMRGVSGEEYPIGRAIFEQTYTLETTSPPPPAKPAMEPVAYRYKYLNFMGDEVWSQELPRNGKVLETQALFASPKPSPKVLLTDDYGKPDEMPDEAWRLLTQVIPFRIREVMKGHLYSMEVLHEALNKVADHCLDGYGWSTGQWKPVGQYGVAIESGVQQKVGLK